MEVKLARGVKQRTVHVSNIQPNCLFADSLGDMYLKVSDGAVLLTGENSRVNMVTNHDMAECGRFFQECTVFEGDVTIEVTP